MGTVSIETKVVISGLNNIKDTIMQELQEGIIEILLHMQQQIFKVILEYFNSTKQRDSNTVRLSMKS